MNSREEDCRYGKLHLITETKESERVLIRPESSSRDKYPKALNIGSHFRDGDIVTFDLSEPGPSEAKYYADFTAGLVFGLRGRIKANGSVFILYLHGRDVNESQLDRMSGQLADAHGLLMLRISISQLDCSFVSSLLLVLLILLRLFTYLLLARIVIEMIQSFSRSWQPNRVSLSIDEVILVVADPPVKLLHRLIPPMSMGDVAVDMFVLVLFLIFMILRMVLRVALSAMT